MEQHIQSLVKHLFQKETLQEVTEDELRSFTETHPYSAVGQFLFAKKLQELQSDLLLAQAEKTSLYFHNPTWTSWLLTEDQADWEAVHPDQKSTSPEAVEETVTEPEPITKKEEQAPMETKEGPILPEQPATSNQESATSNQQPEEELVFQSYHTIDYFASQGIKLKAEDLTKDRFGKQLKSFTEWLRSMKRVTPTAISEEMDEVSRHAIQQFASHSVEGKEAETEAMAEVWVKQGNIEKAIDVYSKLSLLNPAKRAYFAARIEQLKET
jgi:hypothetical protein